MIELTIALVATALVFGAFRLLAVSWPRLYYGPTDGLAIFLSSSLPLFAVFRILPVAAIAMVGGVYVGKLNGSEIKFSIAFIALYIGLLTLFRFARRLKYRRRFSLRDLLWLLVASSLSAIGGLLGGLIAPVVSWVFPDIAVSRDALFTALLVAVVVELFRRLRLEEDVTNKAIRDAVASNRAMVDALEMESRQRGIDRWVVPAIYVAEQMQRPKWFQCAERIAYSMGLPVTVGPFQERTEYGGSIAEQAANFCNESAAVQVASRVTVDEMVGTPGVVAAVYALHNNAQPFVALCIAVREELIELEFLPGATPFELEQFRVEFGYLKISDRSSTEFMFDVHLRSDASAGLSFYVGPSLHGEDVKPIDLYPGATRRVYVSAWLVSESWVISPRSEPTVEVIFNPIGDLEFEATWRG